MSLLAHELLGIAIVAGVQLVVLGTADGARRLGVSSELTRKLAHVGSGVTMLVIPQVISVHWTVLIISIGFASLLLGTCQLGLLGGVHGVARGVGGVACYPFAVWLLYVGAFELRDSATLYLVPVLVLALADAAGALVGVRWGQRRYMASPAHVRTVEGSAAFFATALACVAIPLAVAGPLPLVAVVASAVIVALLATMVEAVSTHGSDNLWVPLATMLLTDRVIAGNPDALLRDGLLVAVGCLLLVHLRGARRPATAGTVGAGR